MNIKVTGNKLEFNGKIYDCAIGKNGFSENKKEGDNCTPVGTYPIREVYYKTERPRTNLPAKQINEFDGWCDDVSSIDYNKHIKLPHPARHEKMLRDDHLYDYVVVIGYNDNPIEKGKGSAIFMHVAKPEYAGTEGCVALKKEDLLEVLEKIDTNTKIEITK